MHSLLPWRKQSKPTLAKPTLAKVKVVVELIVWVYCHGWSVGWAVGGRGGVGRKGGEVWRLKGGTQTQK